MAALRAAGDAVQQLVINDISLGGVALLSGWTAPVGMGVELNLPGADGPVAARVVRSDGNVLALSFQQNERVLEIVGQAITFIDAIAVEAAA